MSSEKARDYFEFLADLGLTKHFGSMDATRELVALCRIGSGQVVLDVGCGVGATPSYLAREAGSRVVAIDLLEKMVEQSRQRAREEGLAERIAFAAADARRLPFEDNLFDAVITESVIVFLGEKRKALGEYMRVTKPGGYVGITEATWLRPPSPELEVVFKRMVGTEPLEASSWTELLGDAGVRQVSGSAHQIDIRSESMGRLDRYGCSRIVRATLKMLVALFKDRRYREFLKDGTGALSRDLVEDVGYGVFVGRKP